MIAAKPKIETHRNDSVSSILRKKISATKNRQREADGENDRYPAESHKI